jgi:hypothetical protein
MFLKEHVSSKAEEKINMSTPTLFEEDVSTSGVTYLVFSKKSLNQGNFYLFTLPCVRQRTASNKTGRRSRIMSE